MSELQFKIQTGTGVQIYPVSNRPQPKNIRKIIIRCKNISSYPYPIQHVAIAPIVLVFPTNSSKNLYKGYDEAITKSYDYQSGRVRFNENKELGIKQFDLTLNSNKRTYNTMIKGLTGKDSASQYFLIQETYKGENIMEDLDDEWIISLEGNMNNLIGINTNPKPYYTASGTSHMRVQMIDFSGICVCDQLITYEGYGGDGKTWIGYQNSNISGIEKTNIYEMINFYVNDTWEKITTPYYHLMRDKIAKETEIPYGILL